MNFSLYKIHYKNLLVTLEEHSNYWNRLALFLLLCFIIIIIMTIRILMYFMHIGALHIRLNPTVDNTINKNHILTNIHLYRLIYRANTYLNITCALVMLDSILMYPFHVIVVILTYIVIEKTSRQIADRLRYSNPPLDDIQFCEFLINTRILFIALFVVQVIPHGAIVLFIFLLD